MAEVTQENAPRKARDMFEKGFAAMERGTLDYAIDMFLAALDIEPGFLKARKFLRAAEIRRFKEKKGGALTHMLANVQGGMQTLTVNQLIKKNPAEALKATEKLMRIDPLNLGFIKLLHKAAVAASMPEVAIQTLEVAKDHYPKNVELLTELAKLLTDTNQMRAARQCYEEIARLNPNDPKALKMLKDSVALDTMQQGGWSEASSYRDVMKDAKEATLLEQDAKAVKSATDLDALIKETSAKVEREPENINYKRALADLLARAERFDEAMQVLRTAQETTGRADPQVERALSALHVKKFDHDIAQLQQAGQTAEAEKKAAEKDTFLVEDAAERVRRYPNDLQFRYEYGVLLFEHQRLNEAIEELQMAQRNPQRRIRALYYLALCFKEKKQYDIALEQLEKAASELNIMDNTKKDIFYEIGLLNEAMGQPDKAATFYKEIYSVDIRYKDVATRIEKTYKK